jgi:hypothetical protein
MLLLPLVLLLVIVDDLDLEWLTQGVIPNETDPPLIVDTNRPLPLAITLERLKAPTGHHTKISKRIGRKQVLEPSLRFPFNGGEGGNTLACGKAIGSSVGKFSRHGCTSHRRAIIVSSMV